MDPRNSAPQHVSVHDAVATRKTNETYPSHLPPDLKFSAIDEKLYNACGTIEASRRELHQYRGSHAFLNDRCATYDRMLRDEQRKLSESSNANKSLLCQHNKALSDVHGMANKVATLQVELKKANEALKAQQTKVKDYERYLNGDPTLDEIRRAQVEQGPPKEKLEAKIAQLEKEKIDMQQEHRRALNDTTDRILAAQKKIEELEKASWELTRTRTVSPCIRKRQNPSQDEQEPDSQYHDVQAKSRTRPHLSIDIA